MDGIAEELKKKLETLPNKEDLQKEDYRKAEKDIFCSKCGKENLREYFSCPRKTILREKMHFCVECNMSLNDIELCGWKGDLKHPEHVHVKHG